MAKKVPPFRTLTNGSSAQVLMGCVCIPRDADRDEYINTFYNTGMLCAIVDNQSFYNRVNVSAELMQDIVFPEDNRSVGSCLVMVVRDINVGSPIAIGVLKYPSQYDGDVLENGFKFSRSFFDNIVAIRGDAQNGNLMLTVKGQLEGQGLLDIDVSNPTLDALIRINVAGTLRMSATDSLILYSNKTFSISVFEDAKNGKRATVSYVLGRGLLIVDEFENRVETKDNLLTIQSKNGNTFSISDDKVNISVGDKNFTISEKFISLGEKDKSKYFAVLGEELLSIMQELLTQIQLITVNTAGVPSTPPINISAFQSIATKLNKILSKSVTLE